MSVKKIILFPDPRLSQSSEPIQFFDTSLQNLIRDLFDTLVAGPGVGLAAPQIGVPKRVSVIDLSRQKMKRPANPLRPTAFQKLVLINPVLVSGGGIQIPREGCLSVPDMLANVRRYEHVSVQTADETGQIQTIRAHGFEALALQHEIDHLNGTLFLDRVVNIRTDIFRRQSY